MTTGSVLWLLGLGLLSGGFSWFLTNWAQKMLVVRGVVDIPNHRSSHDRVVARGGGVVVAALTGALSLAGWLLTSSASTPLITVLTAALTLGAVGFLDDLRGLTIRVRISVQTGASLLVAVVLVRQIQLSPAFAWLVILAATLFFVGSTNIFNFMDGIDGISAMTAAAFGASTLLYGALFEAVSMNILGATLLTACCGFLIHNWHPARIFLGDSGSLFLGLTTCGIPLVVATESPQGFLLLGALVPFLTDGAGTLIQRWRRGERLTDAHRSHVYQRASQRWGHAHVAFTYGVAAGACGVLPVLSSQVSVLLGAFVLIVASIAAVGGWLLLSQRLDPIRSGGW